MHMASEKIKIKEISEFIKDNKKVFEKFEKDLEIISAWAKQIEIKRKEAGTYYKNKIKFLQDYDLGKEINLERKFNYSSFSSLPNLVGSVPLIKTSLITFLLSGVARR